MESTETAIVCLGKSFENDDERREYFREELRKKLPELKKIEGFPKGEDDDILALSDPPYYTACPNPWVNEMVEFWEGQKECRNDYKKDLNINEPYANDISEGKNNPIYNAHSYHTKVPHPAIMRYILHYTQPGDVVLDGFVGTGMTGVAAFMCENPDAEIKYMIEKERRDMELTPPKWGIRRSILSDLSPVASFIAYNCNTPLETEKFSEEINEVFSKVEIDTGWMYQTVSPDGRKGTINYTVWSEVFNCPQCMNEIIFWDVAVDKDKGAVLDEFECPKCHSLLNKRGVEKAWITEFDPSLNRSIRHTKMVPVVINYSVDGRRFEKRPDSKDLALIDKISELQIPYWHPTHRMPEGDEARRNDRDGITHAHQFFTKRNLWSAASYLNHSNSIKNKFLLTAVTSDISKMARVKVGYYFKGGGGPFIPGLAGTLYIPSLSVEKRPLFALENRLNTILSSLKFCRGTNSIISTTSASNLDPLKNNSVDYIFTDPPFGANIMYSELNFLMETWLKVLTENNSEAIENKSQGKSILEYQRLMEMCFKEYFRVLKPGKWMTVEFSNTSAAVWNGIQTSIQKAGFVIANVTGLDKKQGSFKAVTTPTAVKQDLVISCYKLSDEFDKKFNNVQDEVSVWDFVIEHLQHLPVHLRKDSATTMVIERSPKILYDRLITFYLMRGLSVPIDAKDFQVGLKQRFSERDGMYFTPEQVAEYDEKKINTPESIQLSLIVANETDAIEWLKDRLRKNPSKYQDIMPDFRIATQSLRRGDSLPELQIILNENFIQDYDGSWRLPDMNEAKDREVLRAKMLLKEYSSYVTLINQAKSKRLKEVRVEALRAGFKNSWEKKDFATIVKVSDMIPQNILLEDEQLLMYYDIAKDRV